jgi:internalin A
MQIEDINQLKSLFESENIETIEKGTALAESYVEDSTQFKQLLESVVNKTLTELHQDILFDLFEGFHHQAYLGLWSLGHFGKWESNIANMSNLNLNSKYLQRIPASIENLHTLQGLHLNHNRLTNIPDSILRLSSLRTLSISNNSITEIPASIEHLSRLTTLKLSNNKISSIPASISQLSNLTTLNMSRNEISDLPEKMGNMTTLTHITFIDCPIYSIPQTFRQLTNLEHLNISLCSYIDDRTMEQKQAIRNTFQHSLLIEFRWDPHSN